MTPTNTTQFIEELDGGVLAEKLGRAISSVSNQVTTYQKRKGEITLKIKMESVGNGSQVKATSTLTYKSPQMNGIKGEEDTTATVFYVNEGGNTTLFPENQTQMFTTKDKDNA